MGSIQKAENIGVDKQIMLYSGAGLFVVAVRFDNFGKVTSQRHRINGHWGFDST